MNDDLSNRQVHRLRVGDRWHWMAAAVIVAVDADGVSVMGAYPHERSSDLLAEYERRNSGSPVESQAASR